MSEQTISLGILAVLLLFAVSGAIWGVFRGLRKTVWRGVWLLLTAFILFFSAGAIVEAFFYTKFSFVSLVHDGQTYNSIHSWLLEVVKSNFSFEDTPENTILITQLINLSKLILNSIVFAVLFLLFKYLLAPLSSLFYYWFFRSTEEKEYKNKLQQYKIDDRLYKLHVKKFKKVVAHGFADDFIEYEENLKEIKENKKSSSLELLQALKSRIDKKTIEAQHASRSTKENEAIKNLIENGSSPSQLKAEIDIEKTELEKARAIKDKIDIEELHQEEKEIDKIIDKEKSKFGDSLHRPGEVIPADSFKKVEEKKEKPEKKEREEFVPKDEYQPKPAPEKPDIVKPEKPTRPKKRRLWGMLVGAMIGLFSCAMVLTPITGMLNLATEINNRSATIVNEEPDRGLLFELLGTDEKSEEFIKPFLTTYKQSITNGALKYSGVNAVSLFTFRLLSNTKINDITLNMIEDLLKMVDITVEGLELSKSLTVLSSDLTVQEIDELLASVKVFLEKAFDVQIIRALGNDFFPLIEQYALEEIANVGLENSDLFVDMILSIFNALNEDSSRQAVDLLRDDIFAFIEVLQSLNENIIENNQPTNDSVLTIILRQSFERDTDRLVNFLTTDNNASKTFSKLLNTRITSAVLPHISYLMIDYLANLKEVDIEISDELEEYKKLQMNDAVLGIVLETLNIFKNIDFSKGFDAENISPAAFVSVGKILDKVKNGLIPPATYDTLVERLKEEMIASLQDVEDIDISKAIYAIANNLELVENWENEFLVLAAAFDGLFNEVNGLAPVFDLTKEIDIQSLNYQRLGVKLDILKKGYDQKTSVLFSGVYKNESDEEFDGFFKNNETSNLHLLIANILESVARSLKQDSATNDMAYHIANMIEEKMVPRVLGEMDKNANLFWRYELVTLSTLLDIQDLLDNDDQAIDLVDFGDLIDKFVVKESKLILESDIRQLLVNVITDLKDEAIKDIENLTIKTALTDAIGSINDDDSIIYNLYNAESLVYKNELAHLKRLLDIDFSTDTGTLLGYLQLIDGEGNDRGLYVDYNTILPDETAGKGGVLDGILNNMDSEENSKIITKPIINKLLISIIDNLTADSLDGDYEGLVESIKLRLETLEINSYAQEFKAIQYLLDISNYVQLSSTDESALEKIGSYFDDIAYSLLVGDSGKKVLVSVVNSISNESELQELLDNINSAVGQLIVDDSNIIDVLVNNVENINYDIYNFANQYKEMGALKNLLEDMSNKDWIDNITFAEIPAMKTNVYDISESLQMLQSNLIAKSSATRHIAVYIYSSLKQAMYNEGAPELNESYTDYIEGYAQYLVESINNNNSEFYWNSEWEVEDAEVLEINPAYDSDNPLADDYHYALIKIINDYQKNVVVGP